MSASNSLRNLFSRIETARARARTRRILENLPPELQKDVGYPGLYGAR